MTQPSDLYRIAEQFDLKRKPATIQPLGPGFINDTYIVKTDDQATSYILQRKNTNIFPNIKEMMDNEVAVTNHLRAKVKAAGGDPDSEVLTIIPTHSGQPYFRTENGEYWTVCLYINDSVTYERADTPLLAYKGGQGIGRFQSQLADFDKDLYDTLPGFHNMRFRFEQWDEALKADAAGRRHEVEAEIAWIEERRHQMLEFWKLIEDGVIPRRVAHNDTKISNILFDRQGNVLCVIDLDTVMLSTSLNDFGDAIRSYTNTGAEDDPDLDKVGINLELFEAYTRGYLDERRTSMSPVEIDNLAFSALFITFEQTLRFLMDYINGDTYYKIAYPLHNLVRTRAQQKLAADIEKNLDKMKAIVIKHAHTR